MPESCRSWWRNCALEADPEIQTIDELEDRLAPIDTEAGKIRELISSLELCHHKAERWIRNIIEAIGAGETGKGMGTRTPGRIHPAEKIWQDACAALSAWCEDGAVTPDDMTIDAIQASRILDLLGERSQLKKWQVQRVIEKIRSSIHWPQALDDPAARYHWLLLSGGEYDSIYRNECPERHREKEDLWLRTVRTIIRDRIDGEEAELSLGLAIDMLWPCHWNFLENLRIVLEAIGGKLNPEKAFAACARNISLVPARRRFTIISSTLKVFCGDTGSNQEIDGELLPLLGRPTGTKRWLAASLDKTIRLQLNPPAELQAMSALDGPGWIKE